MKQAINLERSLSLKSTREAYPLDLALVKQ